MSSEASPGQIPAYEIHGTHYPYIQVKQSLFNPILADFRRAISSFNPFAMRQIPSQDRMALGLRWGNGFFVPEEYPNGSYFDAMFPTHYDPLSETKKSLPTFQVKKYAPGQRALFAFTNDKLPRPCVRTTQLYNRCLMINGDQKCNEEKKEILEVCPNWALDEMKEKTKQFLKIMGVQHHIYRRAMEVSDYNKGRDMSQVSGQTWVDGTRFNLRPDTMYPDERYTKITQAEINQAKKRVAEREERKQKHHEHAHGHGHDHAHGSHADHHDHGPYVPWRQEKPLYP